MVNLPNKKTAKGVCFGRSGGEKLKNREHLTFCGSPAEPQSRHNGPTSTRGAKLNDMKLAVQYCGEQSRTTHGAEECVAASRLFGEMLVRALNGADKESVLAAPEHAGELPPKLAAIAAGSYRAKWRAQVKGSGYVVESLEASLWCFQQTGNYRDAVLMATNLGDDADTTAAITGLDQESDRAPQTCGHHRRKPGRHQHARRNRRAFSL